MRLRDKQTREIEDAELVVVYGATVGDDDYQIDEVPKFFELVSATDSERALWEVACRWFERTNSEPVPELKPIALTPILPFRPRRLT